jgi:GntR family transcriptional regulator, transcriptional repressor for pyruvate dehydrogenase complex
VTTRAGSARPRVRASAAHFPKTELPRAADVVSTALVDGIRAGVAPVGSLLPRDTELAQHFGVSRLVVRDALNLLRRAGLVDIRSGPGGGAVVKSLSIPTRLLTSLDQPEAGEIRASLEARRAIESATVPLAATRRTPPDLDALQQLVDELTARHDDPESFIELDVRFHLRIASVADNPQLERFLGSVFRDLAAVRSRYPVEFGSMRAAEEHQRDTLEALRSGDPKLAVASIDRHLRGLEEHFFVDNGPRRKP